MTEESIKEMKNKMSDGSGKLEEMIRESQAAEQRKMMERKNAEIPRDVMEKVDAEIKAEFPPEDYRLGMCYTIRARKKEKLEKLGFEWFSPKETDPTVMFD